MQIPAGWRRKATNSYRLIVKPLFLLGFEMRQGEQPVNDKPLRQFRLRSAYHDPAVCHGAQERDPDPAQGVLCRIGSGASDQ
ncbi:MAG: hypothetical protein EOQ86_12535 [Mesorhizobium sp.]|uniref:hypothetical protein n=1 Tax=Mesorhizobium sp. TaxID=1871066 RepID=UPI000FE85944|nr:hypothetical protein [Mesorhizobium sp.]RWH80284.1 MAG: hypothetical protein EOQ85_09980 [Mesorhizobium sp.]RWH83253.1 MAG: hypothetical protein EOQ86_12535 [Mesorhizobium sp.]RWH91864.1 MAG: hypothetical protein EOQ87_06650 [Mesorhizobium sp.]RWI00517.1 MAG: hypothetical protein EOQ88_06625 [Mesorhizobium sp.]RWI06395.1 MAG: hypothetical protein EOQ89_01180 [Mesorhizobium sp.]